jgi:hypothetical protein
MMEKLELNEALCELVDILMEIEARESVLWLDVTPYLSQKKLDELWMTRTPRKDAERQNNIVLGNHE